jgi:uncharacterized protein DUF1298
MPLRRKLLTAGPSSSPPTDTWCSSRTIAAATASETRLNTRSWATPATVAQTVQRIARPIVAAPWNAAAVTEARTLAWLQCWLREVARIRATFGGTVNDVMLAMLSEGAARYLAHHHCPTEGRPLRIGCPVNVRANDEYGKQGNRVSMMFPEFDARPMTAVERLKAVIKETSRIKVAREPMAFENLATLDYIPPATLRVTSQLLTAALGGSGRLTGSAPQLTRRAPMLGTGISFVATNIPGSPVPIYFAGHKMSETVGMVPAHCDARIRCYDPELQPQSLPWADSGAEFDAGRGLHEVAD